MLENPLLDMVKLRELIWKILAQDENVVFVLFFSLLADFQEVEPTFKFELGPKDLFLLIGSSLHLNTEVQL